MSISHHVKAAWWGVISVITCTPCRIGCYLLYWSTRNGGLRI